MIRGAPIVVFVSALLLLGSSLGAMSRAESAPSVSSPAAAIGEAIKYVRTIDSGTIKEFSRPRSIWGKLLEWVAGPAEFPEMRRPYGLTEDSQGRVIISDPGLGVVHILDFERRRHELLRGGKRESFVSPIAVAVDAEDRIYVADSERARIYLFSQKGKFLRTFGGGSEGVTFQRPTGIAIDPQRRLLYVTDTLRHQILVLDHEGKLLKTFGRRGSGPGEFHYPTALTLAKGELYVVDAMNFRVQELTPEGQFVRTIGHPGNRFGNLNRPKGVALDSAGNIYIVDMLFEAVQVFDVAGNLLYYFGSPGEGESEFTLPSGIHVAARDRIYVVDSYNQRIQIFQHDERERP